MGGAGFASLGGETNFASARLNGSRRRYAGRLRQHRQKLERNLTRPIGSPSISEPRRRAANSAGTHKHHVRDRELVRFAVIRPRGGQSFAEPVRALCQYSTIQSAKASRPTAWLTVTTRRRQRLQNLTPRSPLLPAISSLFPRKARVTPGVCDLNALLPKVKPSTLLPVDEDFGARSCDCGVKASELSRSRQQRCDRNDGPETQLRRRGRH